MIREHIHDPLFLECKSEVATLEDLHIANDLLDTINAHKEECVGMAANMIGFKTRIIVFDNMGNFEKWIDYITVSIFNRLHTPFDYR